MPKRDLISLTSANKVITVDRTGDAFVDDSQLGCISHSLQENSTALNANQMITLRKMTNIGQRWERLLFSTGGALNLQKSFWILLTWSWKNGHLVAKDQHPLQLKLTSGYDTTPVEVPWLDPHEGFCTLGAYISPSGSMALMITNLSRIAIEYATSITGTKKLE